MAIQSPCVDICKIDGDSGLCIGCLRTRAEIREWKGMPDDQRSQLLDELARRAAERPPKATPAPASEFTSTPQTS
jgi:predicted Fe-S protein YdhL (DUF1289 family)